MIYKRSGIPWTPEEDAILAEMYASHSSFEIAERLERTSSSVINRRYTLKLDMKVRMWTDEELEMVRANYSVPLRVGFLKELSKAMGRHKSCIAKKAGEMGLTDSERQYGRKVKERKYNTDEERNAATGLRIKAYIALHGPSRGGSGLKLSDATKALIGAKSRIYNASRTPEQLDAIRKKTVETMIAKYGRASMVNFGSSNPYSRAKGGKRADLGNSYFRSAWEANYARYLNFLVSKGQIKSWEYEPHCFVFHGITRGVISYTPDFKVFEMTGEYAWHEVKGWMDAKSKAKLKRMAKYYPNEKVVLIQQAEYKSIKAFARMIEGWEE